MHTPAQQRIASVAVLGTSTPRQCGIATFTADLSTSIQQANPALRVDTIAVSDARYTYGDGVVFEVGHDDLRSYARAATFLNQRNYDVLCVQHEYGIFGGEAGEHLLELVRQVNMPIVTTLHTVLRNPSAAQKRVLDTLMQLSERVVVMSRSAIDLLIVVHGVDESKIDFIPHGIPDIPPSIGEDLRQELGEAGPILLTFGLLSPDKGIQSVIQALPSVIAKCPDAQYVVVGVTHPHELAKNGEAYRNGLQALAEKLGVADRVSFVNEFVSLEKLTEFLSATDYYITPYLNPMQITSGTLAYSMGAGKVIISTPYTYAQELLAEGRGILVPFGDSYAIETAVVESWRKPTESQQMRETALAFGRDMDWAKVGARYVASFEQAVADSKIPMVPIAMNRGTPELSLAHLEKLTDDTGIFQHATYSVPNRFEGYCVDDNARALLLTVQLESSGYGSEKVRKLQATYLSFVAHALNPANARFRNFMSYDRSWLESAGSEDSQARTIWALGQTIANGRDEAHVWLAEKIFDRAMPAMFSLRSPRAMAYTILGASAYLEAHPGCKLSRRLVEHLGLELDKLYLATAWAAWPWLESRLSYANARIPHAMMIAGEVLRNDELIEHGLTSLSWLMDHQVAPSGCFSPVGTAGAGLSEVGTVQFDQQPIEVWASASACITASRLRDRERFMDMADNCYAWFLGRNVLGAPMGCPVTGAGFDGLERSGVNRNQGAESTLAFLCTWAELQQVKRDCPGAESAVVRGFHA
jgi:glycosyltransferase involved in cell wall biosynthesis